MYEDETMAELRAARDAYAKRFNYDLAAIFRDLQEKQARRTDREVVPARPKTHRGAAELPKKSA